MLNWGCLTSSPLSACAWRLWCIGRGVGRILIIFACCIFAFDPLRCRIVLGLLRLCNRHRQQKILWDFLPSGKQLTTLTRWAKMETSRMTERHCHCKRLAESPCSPPPQCGISDLGVWGLYWPLAVHRQPSTDPASMPILVKGRFTNFGSCLGQMGQCDCGVEGGQSNKHPTLRTVAFCNFLWGVNCWQISFATLRRLN